MSMTIKRQLLGLVGLGLVLALTTTACAPADPPAKPSFATDVLPVMKAHCTRCHGDKGLMGDPGVTAPNPLFHGPPLDGYFTQYGDMKGCPTMQAGALAGTYPGCQGAFNMAAKIKIYITTDSLRMPPQPSDPLSDWDIKLLSNWVDSGALP
jgi:hypothetical protein